VRPFRGPFFDTLVPPPRVGGAAFDFVPPRDLRLFPSFPLYEERFSSFFDKCFSFAIPPRSKFLVLFNLRIRAELEHFLSSFVFLHGFAGCTRLLLFDLLLRPLLFLKMGDEPSSILVFMAYRPNGDHNYVLVRFLVSIFFFFSFFC